MATPRLHVPAFNLRLLDGSVCEFRADHLGLYELELLSKIGLFEYFRLEDQRQTRFYELAYAFSASWREDSGMNLPFRKFLQRLPVQHFLELRGKLFGIAFEAIQAGAPRGNWLGPARPALAKDGTGSGGSRTGFFGFVVRCVSSGVRLLGSIPRLWRRGTPKAIPPTDQSTSTNSQISPENEV